VLCRVIVHDDVVVKGREVMLKAETRGRLFAKGGQVVSFFVAGDSIGKTLSGGDGVAYKPFVPAACGLYLIRVTSGDNIGEGRLLCLEKGEGIVFVDIEGTLLAGLSMTPKPGAREAMAAISAKFPVVLLQTAFVGKWVLESWVKKNSFPQLPVLPWRQGAVFDAIAEKGLMIKAVIAGPKVIESAQSYNPLSFCFEDGQNNNKVKNWEEITKALK
jgi:hypothetical protein